MIRFHDPAAVNVLSSSILGHTAVYGAFHIKFEWRESPWTTAESIEIA